MASFISKISGPQRAILIAFFVPLVGNLIFDRAWLGLLIGIISGAAVWQALGGKPKDLKI